MILRLRWTTRDGHVLYVHEMSNAHLRNSINFLLNKPLGDPRTERIRTIYITTMLQQLQQNQHEAYEAAFHRELMEELARDRSWGDN